MIRQLRQLLDIVLATDPDVCPAAAADDCC